MTLTEAKVAAAKESRSQPNKVFYIVVDAEGEADISTKFAPGATTAAYKNGGEIAVPESATEATEETQAETAPVKVAAAKDKKKAATKKATKKAAKKVAAKKIAPKAKSADKKLPEGKVMEITVAKALEYDKKGASIYRASNGSPLGKYYLAEYKNKDKKLKLIVREAKP